MANEPRAKWKRKEKAASLASQDDTLSPLRRCLLEQFAAGASATQSVYAQVFLCMKLFASSSCPHSFHGPTPNQGSSIQQIAMCAEKTYNSSRLSKDVEDLASLGNFGRQPQHIAKQLVKKYCKGENNKIPEPYLFECPFLVKSKDSVDVARKPLAIFLPHEWFAWACNNHDQLHDEAAEIIMGWSCMKEFWKQHLKLKDPRTLFMARPAECVPLLLHGDGGSFQRYDFINVISFRSLLSSANVANSQLLLAAIPKSSCNKDDLHPNLDTMKQVWKALAWSLEALYERKFPSSDHNGQPFSVNQARGQLAGQLLNSKNAKLSRAVVFAFTGDGEWFQNECKLKGASFNECCFNCKANKSTIP